MKMCEKWIWGQGSITTQANFQSVNVALLVISIQVDCMQCSVLIDTGYSRLIVCANQYQAWSRRHAEIRTIDSMSQACCEVGIDSVYTERGNCAEVNVLVKHEKPLGHNSLIRIDGIWALGSSEIISAGEVQLGRKHESCVAITVEELYFCVIFNHEKA